MKLLKIENNQGHFLDQSNAYQTIDKMSKETLLWIMERVLDGSGEMDEYDESEIKNQAHQVIYKSLYGNLKALDDRKKEFLDASERLYLDDYKRYVDDVIKPQSVASESEAPSDK